MKAEEREGATQRGRRTARVEIRTALPFLLALKRLQITWRCSAETEPSMREICDLLLVHFRALFNASSITLSVAIDCEKTMSFSPTASQRAAMSRRTRSLPECSIASTSPSKSSSTGSHHSLSSASSGSGEGEREPGIGDSPPSAPISSSCCAVYTMQVLHFHSDARDATGGLARHALWYTEGHVLHWMRRPLPWHTLQCESWSSSGPSSSFDFRVIERSSAGALAIMRSVAATCRTPTLAPVMRR